MKASTNFFLFFQPSRWNFILRIRNWIWKKWNFKRLKAACQATQSAYFSFRYSISAKLAEHRKYTFLYIIFYRRLILYCIRQGKDWVFGICFYKFNLLSRRKKKKKNFFESTAALVVFVSNYLGFISNSSSRTKNLLWLIKCLRDVF